MLPGNMLTLICLFLAALRLTGSEFTADPQASRARLIDALGPKTLLIIQSAPERTYSLDIEYEYRQDSSFYYLTGLDQTESTLVLMPGNSARREILFVKEKNPVREHWTGKVLTQEQ